MRFLFKGEQIDYEALAARKRSPEDDDWLLPIPGEYIRVFAPEHGIHSVMTLQVRPSSVDSAVAHFSPDGHWATEPGGCGFGYHDLRMINQGFSDWFPLSCIKTKARLALEKLGARL